MAHFAEFISEQVDNSIIPLLMDFIRIPNLSPNFDSEWNTNGYIDQAINLLINWVDAQNVSNLSHEILIEPNTPPLLFFEVAASVKSQGTILMYGHMDKQPHFTGWREGTGPTTPAIIDGHLYGRGGLDDGYALPGAIAIIKALQMQNKPHGKIIIIIEGEEESGSAGLMGYIERLNDRIGQPDVIFCLDSGCGNLDQLWITQSLRGLLTLQLTVKLLEQGVHSGDGSGIVPDSFRILRILLDRLEDSRTGVMKLPDLFQELTPRMYADAAGVSEVYGDDLFRHYSFCKGVQSITTDLVQSLLNRGMLPMLSIIGASGFPDADTAGNVILPNLTIKLSIRLPPGVDQEIAKQAVIKELTRDPPYNAKIEISQVAASNGFLAPAVETWLDDALTNSSLQVFGKPVKTVYIGGSIPFMGLLAQKFPKSQFIVSGISDPGSGAHSSNERLNINYLKQFLCCMAYIAESHGIVN